MMQEQECRSRRAAVAASMQRVSVKMENCSVSVDSTLTHTCGRACRQGRRPTKPNNTQRSAVLYNCQHQPLLTYREGRCQLYTRQHQPYTQRRAPHMTTWNTCTGSQAHCCLTRTSKLYACALQHAHTSHARPAPPSQRHDDRQRRRRHRGCRCRWAAHFSGMAHISSANS